MKISLFERCVLWVASRGYLNWLPDEKYIRLLYYVRVGKSLNIDNPRSFSEKIQWLKLYNHNENYVKMVDKCQAKDYVIEKIGEEYIIPTLGVWNEFDEIDFRSLPESFVIKCTHDSGGVHIVKNKSNLDISLLKKKVEKSLKRNYFYHGREWPYKTVVPRIIVEEYLETEDGADLTDYKFFCFNGTPKYCQVITDRSSIEKIDFFDMSWNHQEFVGLLSKGERFENSAINIDKPKKFDEMKKIATTLSKDIPFVRIDMYEINGKVYFGEITFYPANGFGVFTPEKWNMILGDYIKTSF